MPRVLKGKDSAEKQVDAARQLRSEALAAGARQIRLCSQAYGELKKLLVTEDQGGGICRSLCMAWLVERKAGRNLLDTLLGPGGTVRTAMVTPMCATYRAKGAMNRIVERAYIVSELTGSGLGYTGTQEAKAADVRGVGAWFCQSSAQSGIGQLRAINTRDGYNHAMALDLRDATRPLFFDPNWGEFQFPSDVHLVNFFNTSMFTKHGADTLYADSAKIHNVEKICFS